MAPAAMLTRNRRAENCGCICSIRIMGRQDQRKDSRHHHEESKCDTDNYGWVLVWTLVAQGSSPRNVYKCQFSWSGPLRKSPDSCHVIGEMVWASLSNARATAAAVQPCASSHSACHFSRSRGVGARYVRRRTSPSSICHRSSSDSISIMPNSNPHSDSFTDQLNSR